MTATATETPTPVARFSWSEAVEAEITHLGKLVIALTTDVAELAAEVRRLRKTMTTSERPRGCRS
jgi:hypothetical protein